MSVLDHYVCSDHFPLSVILDFKPDRPQCSDPMDSIKLFDWKSVSDSVVKRYYEHSGVLLNNITLPCDILHCTNPQCLSHINNIDVLYNDIVNCLHTAVSKCIPSKSVKSFKQIPGWNDLVKDSNELARQSFKLWVAHGKPRFGPVYNEMRVNRANFKYNLRYLSEETIKSDLLANDLSQHDVVEFWKNVKRMNQSRTGTVNSIDNITGEQNIAEYWSSHYKDIFNSNQSTSDKDNVLSQVNNVINVSDMNVSPSEISDALKKLKHGKAAGPDELHAEALIGSHERLHVLLALCFSAMLSHGYIPANMMSTKIIPIVKNKCGKLTDTNNYRPVALANITSKLFEFILLNRCETYLYTNDNQFGFKEGHSTDMCIFTLLQFIDYYKSKCTNIYVTFLDASKAFDRLNHWLLFKKLLNRGMPIYIVRILIFWYSNQTMYVQWGSAHSDPFSITNGVRQGGILSPKLFIVYMDGLSLLLNNTNIGGTLNGKQLNHISYADDLCLLSISSAGMQRLLNICEEYGVDHDLIYNSTKSMCMCFKTNNLSKHDPLFNLNNAQLQYVEEAKYRGVYIHKNSTDCDVKRQMRKFYANINMLLRQFHYCSYDVKCHLFKTFCSNMYCCSFWFKSTKGQLNKLRVSYNNSLRRLLNLPTWNSASEMFVNLNIPSFGELMRKSIHSFVNRITECKKNSIISSIVNSSIPLISNIWKWWRSILYMKR